jgi:hypothetical protein
MKYMSNPLAMLEPTHIHATRPRLSAWRSQADMEIRGRRSILWAVIGGLMQAPPRFSASTAAKVVPAGTTHAAL